MKLAHKISYFTLALICLLPHCTKIQRGKNNSRFLKKKVTVLRTACDFFKTIEPSLDPPAITIWVHGTHFLRKTVFYDQLNGQPGLIHPLDIDYKHSLHQAAQALHTGDPKRFPLETCYLFVWSGSLSAENREFSAHALYKEIQNILTVYQEFYTQRPIIRLITHSHGGNLALNLAKIQKDTLSPITIDELILLGCPVQGETMHLAQNPLFKSVYSFYSSLDFVQIIAPQMLYKVTTAKGAIVHSEFKLLPFSGRCFPSHDNIVQLKIKFNGRALFHQEFTYAPFLSTLGTILDEASGWHDKQERYQKNIKQLLCVYTKHDH